ncbi:alpha/beta hydrolase [Agromyces aurantiacus]|uniref:Alpha/beta hydrolase n=1 Tax=Agromyces aurantiacus TaxID=165814 RepID=A0ABV9R9I7_9MICO|nr:alpha/beta hydrolase fold domain-containing protein [Agromyces aurantiacus]MBM7505187.1 acetyl esterase/lipase [Agromyces aurantiacus]
MTQDARVAGAPRPASRARERLALPRPSAKATATGIAVAILRHVAPGLLVRIAGRATDGGIPPFVDLLRIAELAGTLPSTDPSSSPTGILARFPQLADVATRDVVIAGPHGPVRARTYRPPHPSGIGLVWVHGGAFISGDLDRPDAHWPALELAHRGVAVVSVDYRHAVRGVHHPVPSDDVLAGWRWAAAHAAELGVARGALHLGGSSVGASLAAGVAKRVRDSGIPETTPAGLVLVTPFLHSSAAPWPADLLARMRASTRSAVFSPDDLTHLAWNYAGRRSVLDDPYAFPANGDLAGLPPTLVITEEIDTIRTSGEDFASRLRAAGVPAVVRMTPGAAHSSMSRPAEPTAQVTLDAVAEHLLGRWSPQA